MRRAASVSYIITICVLLLMSTSNTACGRSIIKGKVVDQDTGKPIEKAAIYIHWWKEKGMPGLSHSANIETAETVTDDKGAFEIPKYSTLVNEFRMAVYKKGYVCWSSQWMFPSYEKRKEFSLRDGVVIQLEQFTDKHSREKHADFTIRAAIWSTGVFSEAIEQERELQHDHIQKKSNEREESK